MLYDATNLAVAQDACPTCGPVTLTTVGGVLVALRLDRQGVCRCSPEARARAAAKRVDAVLRAALGAALPPRARPEARPRPRAARRTASTANTVTPAVLQSSAKSRPSRAAARSRS